MPVGTGKLAYLIESMTRTECLIFTLDQETPTKARANIEPLPTIEDTGCPLEHETTAKS